MPGWSLVDPVELAFLEAARTATLATVTAEGQPRLVPVCFVVERDPGGQGGTTIHTPLDEKPKATEDPRTLARVRDILRLPEVSLLVDRWDEDWSRLGWLRLYGRARLLEPLAHELDERARAITALRRKYPQYRSQALESRPIIRIVVDRARAWGNLAL
jgi:PPOX class probable F420-dependent enzyme